MCECVSMYVYILHVATSQVVHNVVKTHMPEMDLSANKGTKLTAGEIITTHAGENTIYE